MRQTEDEHRARLAASLAAQLPREIDRVTWPLEQLWALRDQRLRELIWHAKSHSPWHAKRLKHIDPTTLSGDDLSAIPAMTKADLMGKLGRDRHRPSSYARPYYPTLGAMRGGGPA